MAENAVPATEVKSLETLQQELAAKRADLLEAQRGHRAGELANPRILGVYRPLHAEVPRQESRQIPTQGRRRTLGGPQPRYGHLLIFHHTQIPACTKASGDFFTICTKGTR